MNRPAEAVPQLTKLVEEFEVSEFLVGAQKLLTEIKNAPAVQPASTPKADGDKPKANGEKPKPEGEKPKQEPGVSVKPKTNP